MREIPLEKRQSRAGWGLFRLLNAQKRVGIGYAKGFGGCRMRSAKTKLRRGGFTLIELLMVVTVIGILVTLLLPALAKAKMRAVQSRCASNLRQTGLAFRMFADEHDGLLPMQIPVKKGGTLEYVSQGQPWRHYQTLSNHLVRADLLICPADRLRTATNWTSLSSSNLSYFVGVDARMRAPNTLLAGDRNVNVPGFTPPATVSVNAHSVAYWTEEMHQYRGNILFTDGRVESVDSDGLQRTFTLQALTTKP